MSTPAESTPLDGTRAWSIVGAGFCSMFAVFGVAYSFGPFFEPMAEEFDASAGATSAVFSITAFVYFLLGSVSGLAADRFGPRRVLLVGAVAMGGGLVLTSRVDSLVLGYLTYGVGVGVGVACGYVPMVATVTGWFDRRRATAVGVAVSGIGLGTVTAAPLAAAAIDRYGWRTTYVIFGVVSAAVLVLAAAVVAPAPAHQAAIDVANLRAVMATPTFRTLYAATFTLSLCLFVPFVLLTPFAEGRGIGEVPAASLVAVIGGASIAGRLVIGPFADRVGHLVAFRSCFAIVGASFALWFASDAFAVLVVFAAVLGVGYGGFVALSPAVVAELFGTEGLGGLIGFTYTSAAFGGLIGPIAAGRIVDASSYPWTIALSGVVGVVAWVVLGRVRPIEQQDVRPVPQSAPEIG